VLPASPRLIRPPKQRRGVAGAHHCDQYLHTLHNQHAADAVAIARDIGSHTTTHRRMHKEARHDSTHGPYAAARRLGDRGEGDPSAARAGSTLHDAASYRRRARSILGGQNGQAQSALLGGRRPSTSRSWAGSAKRGRQTPSRHRPHSEHPPRGSTSLVLPSSRHLPSRLLIPTGARGRRSARRCRAPG